jgi:mitochondrial fission protein ELM1
LCSSTVRADPLVVWRFSDGKRGHDNQSLGLVEALAALVGVVVHTVAVPQLTITLAALVSGRVRHAEALPDPQLLLGAGHATHLPLLVARRARGGRAIVLMKPSLPRTLFDLCIIPRHDGVKEGANVLVTDGVLNRVNPSQTLDPARGLILIGGISPHYRWNDNGVMQQVIKVVGRHPEIQWQIADSRRTPASLSRSLSSLALPNAEFAHHSLVPDDWLSTQLAGSATVWVSEDSVSMIYEALTAGAAVGLIELPATRMQRLQGGIADLLRAGRVTRFTEWQQGESLRKAVEPLNESARCARWILQHWLNDTETGLT